MEEIVPTLGSTKEQILDQIWNEEITVLDTSIKNQPHLMSNHIYKKLILDKRLGGLTFSFGPSVHRLTHESLIHLISDKSAVLVWNPEEQPFDPSILPHPPHVYSKAPNLAGFLLECGLVLLGNEDEDEGSES